MVVTGKNGSARRSMSRRRSTSTDAWAAEPGDDGIDRSAASRAAAGFARAWSALGGRLRQLVSIMRGGAVRPVDSEGYGDDGSGGGRAAGKQQRAPRRQHELPDDPDPEAVQPFKADSVASGEATPQQTPSGQLRSNARLCIEVDTQGATPPANTTPDPEA